MRQYKGKAITLYKIRGLVMGSKKNEGISFGKAGKDSERLASCKVWEEKIFEGKMAFSQLLQDTKGKALTPKGARISKGKALGAIASGVYQGKGKIVRLKDSDGKVIGGKDRIDFHVSLLDKSADSIKWDSINTVGCITK